MTKNDPDKTGEALKAQRFQMLEDIARELSGEVIFPTYFDAVLRLRKVLNDPEQSMVGIANAIAIEPLISAKLLHLANSALYNPSGDPIMDLKSAIVRLGLNTVRSAAMAMVMTQLMRAKGMASFASLTHSLWKHSIQTAAAAHVIARNQTRFNPEEALLAGLIHDLGAFYMLYRATQYDELRTRPDSVRYLIAQWHESIGAALLDTLGLPQEIIDATAEHDHLRPLPLPPRSLGDVIYLANLLANDHMEWRAQEDPNWSDEIAEAAASLRDLIPEIEVLADQMHLALD